MPYPPQRIARELAEVFRLPFSHAQATADSTPDKLYKVPAGRTLVITRVCYKNPTGLAADGTNYFTVKISDGTDVAASWSTLTGAQGALPANTFVELVVATDGKQVLAAGDVLTLFLDETGDTTLPAGNGVIEGYLFGPNT